MPVAPFPSIKRTLHDHVSGARTLNRQTLILVAIACVSALALHVRQIVQPMVWQDDFSMLAESWTWDKTVENLWAPFNEHVMPLGRVTTFALARVVGPLLGIPRAAALQGPLAVVIGMLLLFCFVKREMESPVPALVGMILFGVSSVYLEAVNWFAASFTLLALDTALLALLAAQRWRLAGSRFALFASALAACAAPAWFASGILAGLLSSLYLVPRGRQLSSSRWRSWAALAPCAGTLIFLVLSLPRTGAKINSLAHYGDKSAIQAFDPVAGIWNTCRTLADNLFPGLLGIPDMILPIPLVALDLAAVALLAIYWWRRAEQTRLLLLGLGFIGFSYFLIYSARADWSYDEQTHHWTRYHAFAQLGLALFVCGGMRAPRNPPSISSRLPCVGLMLLVIAMLLAQFPRTLAGTVDRDGEQHRLFERIRIVDERCRLHHISAAMAREVLDPLPVPWWSDRANGWTFLRGSPSPQPLDPERARALLILGD